MARSLIHTLSNRDRRRSSIGVGVDGLADTVDKDNDANALGVAAASARKVHQELSYILFNALSHATMF